MGYSLGTSASDGVLELDSPRHFSPALPRSGLILQIAALGLISSVLVNLERLSLAVVAFYGPLALLLVYYALTRKAVEWATVVVGSIPMLMLLRPVFYQNSVAVILAATLGLWWLYEPGGLRSLFKDTLAMSLIVGSGVYWWCSVLYTGDYSVNLRVSDLVLTGCCVSLLTRYRSYLAAAFWGMSITTVFIVLALWKYGAERLGTAEIGLNSLGHPEQVGMAMALTILVSLVDRGRWLLLQKANASRYVVAGAALSILLLTTSRTSWSLACLGVLMMSFSRKQRKTLVWGVLIMALAGMIVIMSSRGDDVAKYFNKVFSSDRTWSQRTTGRIDQYAAFPLLFWQSPIVGHGPGSSGTIYQRYDRENLVMHSLYLHMGVELGILGLTALLLMYGFLIRRAVLYRRLTAELLPLVCAVAMCVDGAAQNSFNCMMGVFLGLTMADKSAFQRATSMYIPPSEQPAPLVQLEPPSTYDVQVEHESTEENDAQL
jgi:O-antigen ligase